MRLFKRTVAAIISLALCTVEINFASAESNWTMNFVGAAKPKGETYFAEYTMAAKYDGDYALNVVYPNAEITGNYLEISTAVEGTLAAGTYDFKFYMNKSGTGRGCVPTSRIEVAGETFTIADCNDENLNAANVPSGEANWISYTKQLTIAETTNPVIKFTFVGPVRGCYIDEVSLSINGGENLITCGGFETVVQESDVYDTALYTPKDIIVVPTTAGGLALSWRNPQTATIKNIELYEITDSEAVLLSDSFSKSAKAINDYMTGALAEAEKYQYKLLFTYTDVPKMEYFITGTAIAGSVNQQIGIIGPWTVQSYHNNAEHPYGLHKIYIDTTESYEGDASLKIMSNSKGILNDVYTGITAPIEVIPGRDYQLSFMMKSENSDTNLKSHLNWNYFDLDYTDGGGGIYLKDTKGSFEWKKVVFKKSAIESAATSLTLIQDYKSDGVWIDNIEFKLLDENGEPTGDNLIADGGFENLLSEARGDLINVSASGGMGTAHLSWQVMGDVYGVNIYQQVGDEWGFRGTVSGIYPGIDFTELKYDMDYRFKIVAVTADGVEGAAYEVETSTTAPDYMVTQPTLSYGGVSVEAVTSGGTYNVKASVKNNIYTNGMDYEMVVGVFKDGALYDLQSSGAKSIPCSPANSNPTSVSLSVMVPADSSNYSIKVYHINSKAEWGVLTPHTVFE